MKKIMKWSAMLLAGLLLWPAGAAAKETDEQFETRVDPTHVFPQVNRSKYGSNMSMLAVVKRDGTTLSEVSENTIVAVFSGDEIRGKDIIYADQDNMAFVTIYGESTETLTFKVYWDGVVYDCGGSATFASDGFIGATDSPYELDISPVSLADNASNTETLTTWNTKTRDVVLTDRTLYKDGLWNTLCLPFSLDDDQLAHSPLAGCTLMKLDTETAHDGHTTGLDGTKLYLNFTNATTIEAGKPYIIKWTSGTNIENPAFEGVTINSAGPTAVTSSDGKVSFVGTYSPFEITDANINEILYLGGDNTIGYATSKRTLRACRAHFEVPTTSSVKGYVLNFGDEGTTGIRIIDDSTINDLQSDGDAWYDLSGRQLNGKPGRAGIYIHNGRRVVVK